MQNITSTNGLKNAIQLLEAQREIKELQLKEDLQHAYNSFKPLNLLKNTLDDVASSPLLIENILGTTISLATGYITKKIIIGNSDNKFRKLLGSVFQFGVINAVAIRTGSLKMLGRSIYHVFHKKEKIL